MKHGVLIIKNINYSSLSTSITWTLQTDLSWNNFHNCSRLHMEYVQRQSHTSIGITVHVCNIEISPDLKLVRTE